MSTDAFDNVIASVGDFAVSQLTALPNADRARPNERKLASVLSEIVVAIADARERPPGDDEIVRDLDRARASIARTTSHISAGEHPLEELGAALETTRALALERTARAPARLTAEGAPAPPMTASSGAPALHSGVRLEALPRPIAERAFGKLPPRSAAPREATGAQKALRRWARDALEELAINGRLRRPREDEAWTSGRIFEERALVSLDALASLGRGASNDERIDVARAAEDSLHEVTIPDPGRVFAANFTFACLRGYGAAARLHVHARNPSPVTAEAVVDALALGSSPHIEDVVISLLSEDDNPALLERGLTIARRRRRVPQAIAPNLLSHPNLRVAIAAAQACAVIDKDLAIGPLEDALFGPDELAVHAAEALAMQRAPTASWMARLKELSAADNSDVAIHATLLLVLGAGAHDIDPLIERCAKLPYEHFLDLLGWLGSPKTLDRLCTALDDTDRATRERAAWSLSRVTGAGLETLEFDGADDSGSPQGDPESADSAEDGIHVRRHPPLEPAFWTDPIAHAKSASAARLRLGDPLGADSILRELRSPRAHQGARRVLVKELAMLSAPPGSDPLPLDVDDWIVRQERILTLIQNAPSRLGAQRQPKAGGRS